MEFFVLASLHAKQDRQTELRRQLISLVGPSRKDAGNLRYELFADQNDDRRFVILEHWADPQAQQKHHTESEHIVHFEKEQKAALVEKVELFYSLDRIA